MIFMEMFGLPLLSHALQIQFTPKKLYFGCSFNPPSLPLFRDQCWHWTERQDGFYERGRRRRRKTPTLSTINYACLDNGRWFWPQLGKLGASCGATLHFTSIRKGNANHMKSNALVNSLISAMAERTRFVRKDLFQPFDESGQAVESLSNSS